MLIALELMGACFVCYVWVGVWVELCFVVVYYMISTSGFPLWVWSFGCCVFSNYFYICLNLLLCDAWVLGGWDFGKLGGILRFSGWDFAVSGVLISVFLVFAVVS